MPDVPLNQPQPKPEPEAVAFDQWLSRCRGDLIAKIAKPRAIFEREVEAAISSVAPPDGMTSIIDRMKGLRALIEDTSRRLGVDDMSKIGPAIDELVERYGALKEKVAAVAAALDEAQTVLGKCALHLKG